MIKSFRRRVDEFWETFTLKEVKLRRQMDITKNDDQSELNDFVRDMLKIAFSTISFQLTKNAEDRYELMLSPEGNKLRFFQCNYWLQKAPKHLSEYWDFYAYKQRVSSLTDSVEMFGLSIEPKDVKFYTELDDEGEEVKLQIYSPKIMTLEKDEQQQMLVQIMNRAFGEFYRMAYVNNVEILEKEPDVEGTLCQDLDKYIADLIAEHDWVLHEDLSQVFTEYSFELGNPPYALREDVIAGNMSCYLVLSSYLNNDCTIYNEYKKDGMFIGFIYYNNRHLPKEERVAVQTIIAQEIALRTESVGIATYIGTASGMVNSYIDFIVYDLDAFAAIVRKILSKHDVIKTANYSSFVRDDEPIKLK